MGSFTSTSLQKTDRNFSSHQSLATEFTSMRLKGGGEGRGRGESYFPNEEPNLQPLVPRLEHLSRFTNRCRAVPCSVVDVCSLEDHVGIWRRSILFVLLRCLFGLKIEREVAPGFCSNANFVLAVERARSFHLCSSDCLLKCTKHPESPLP